MELHFSPPTENEQLKGPRPSRPSKSPGGAENIPQSVSLLRTCEEAAGLNQQSNMPAPTYPIPTSPSPIQLYRHLLRECSYLPPAFRTNIAKTVQDRFHRHRQNDPRPKVHVTRAKNALRTLRAANGGDKAAMEGLISKGFGRSGNRRRELMAKFVVPQGPSNSQDLEALLDPANETKKTGSKDSATSSPDAPMSKKAFFEKWDQQKLLQALQSQRQQQRDNTKGAVGWRSSTVKTIDPDQFIPKETIWGKPPSDILKRAKRSGWWRRSADKIMPPLGKGEWDLLEQLSNGGQEADEWMIPERRIHVKSLAGDAEVKSNWNWQDYATKPTAIVEKPKSLTHQRRTGQKDDSPYGVGDRDRTISPRWFRRIYNRTWQLTPTMAQDPNTLRYSFAWGRAEAKLPSATKNQLEIFQGVDKRGHKLQKRP
ncbi:hypothetical protein PT974_02271 [Cladobotryum mycophilum]|uniref:LYR motif-containing protein Cup1-like N-terminal domain-containing protein n=1 Tax=Cladobotryum mycophilum TaxID=491253 RepID=A0ABR0SXV4_9HYPO